MESVLLGVIGELHLAAQGLCIVLIAVALNACMISAAIAICTSMIPFIRVQGAPNR